MKTYFRIRGHTRVLVFALVGVVMALTVAVVSFAATSTTVTISVVPAGGVAGEFGTTNSQGVPGSTSLVADAGAIVTVGSAAGFVVGDHILIDEDGDESPAGDAASAFSYHTVLSVSGNDLGVSPEIANTYSTSASVTEPAKYALAANWSPRKDSATGLTAGNHFVVNLHGLTTSDDALTELITANPNELVKNYTFLNRLIGVHVLCESSSPCTGGPYAAATAAGAFGDARDARGEDINSNPDFLTLTNARLAWLLTGGYLYAVTIDGGSLFTIDTEVGAGDSLSPEDQISIAAR